MPTPPRFRKPRRTPRPAVPSRSCSTRRSRSTRSWSNSTRVTEPSSSPIFPVLTAAQLDRLRTMGRERDVASGEVLFRIGDRIDHMYVVLSGQIEAVSTQVASEQNLATLGPGQFTGEVNMLS